MFDASLIRKIEEKCAVPNKDGFEFGKLFPKLPSFADGQDHDDVVKRLRVLGKKSGRMDAHDPLVTISNPLDANLNCDASNADAPCNPDNDSPDMTVGFTFLGQFLDHDITLDRQPLDSDEVFPNERSPFFDLDSVYGKGPTDSAHLYDPDQPAKLRLDPQAPRDLPRNENQEACIPDPRNDENVIISQLHLSFIKFHNQVVKYVWSVDGEMSAEALFQKARKLVLWHYQYVIVNQFLRASLDPAVFDYVRTTGPTVFQPSAKPAVPREFQVAAYRFGHSQIRPGYKINVIFGAPIFDAALDSRDDNDPNTPQDGDPNDLRGGRRAFRRFVEWDTFFDFGTQEVAVVNGQPVVRPKVKRNKRIDPFLSSPLFDLPVGPGLPGPGDELRSLAGRNLERHLKHSLASGQLIAESFGYKPLDAQHTSVLTDLSFHDSTPLWWYILKEALVQQQGRRLGEVGSRIVAEVFFGLLLSDPTSYWSVDRNWKPTLPQRNGDVGVDFTMTDLLTFARAA